MKQLRIFPKSSPDRNPDALLRLFVVIALVSTFVIISVAGLVFVEVLQRHVIRNAEEDAIKVSSALLATERRRLTARQPDGSLKVVVAPADLPEMDRHFRRFLSPFDIVKIKIYSADSRIVYSTEPALIGKVDSHNSRLDHALDGLFDSKLERKEEVKDLASESKFNVDVVETYIPIWDNGRVIGSFEVYVDVTKYRDDTANTAALALGAVAGILVIVFGISYFLIRRGTREIKEIQEVLTKQTMTDALTGTFNKSQIELLACKEFDRCSRRKEKGHSDADLGFIMIDIDRFKEVNDSYGHLAGDVLLQQFAARITRSLRSYDSIGRFGGEEFLVMLPGSDLEQTRMVAQKIWSLLRDEPFLVEGEEISLTASLGAAAVKEGDPDLLHVLKRADQRLYAAKSAGRDRVV
ncbi:diguanylate cyclase [Geoanaerobacter pelophilus]|uniref:diguanylate cyclase n=1 Tax=Geoanaerobacter pelophilus TaxID=60036 RepID=A0ABQ0MP65_9BACT|nr:diguanylate cyclase [Geoanaerobacter pelophilus]GAW68041.1 diguanylate cyclase [Geoanaerobacter pelophilus]